MRVITGTARGKRLTTLEGDQVRPTSDRVKEGLFNIIQFDIEGRRVLDLFAGSGQLAVEALSRGAAQAVLVDKSRKALQVAEENLKSTGLTSRAQAVQMEALAYLSTARERFDIVFLDPPYRLGLLQEALPLAGEKLNRGGVVICEHPLDDPLPETAGNLMRRRAYRYGKIILSVYRLKLEDE